MALPYPFPNKFASSEFSQQKVDLSRYSAQLPRAFALIKHFELDLYENAVIPVALAHRHASISLVPGGKVLELISRHGLASNIV